MDVADGCVRAFTCVVNFVDEVVILKVNALITNSKYPALPGSLKVDRPRLKWILRDSVFAEYNPNYNVLLHQTNKADVFQNH